MLLASMFFTAALAGQPGLADQTGPGPIPADVLACIKTRKMWVADPDFYEELTFTREDGSRERAVQILDHAMLPVGVGKQKKPHTGHLLVFPTTCRIVVLALRPTERPGVRRAQLLGHKVTSKERATLLRWAKHRLPDPPGAKRSSKREGPFWLPVPGSTVSWDVVASDVIDDERESTTGLTKSKKGAR